MTSALISKTSNYSVFLFSLSQMEPGLWFFSSLSVSVGRLKPLSRHQPAFGLGKANESRLHSSLANKSPVKLCILLVRSFSQGRYIFMGIYNFLPSRETSPFTLIKSGVIFTTKHLTCSHLAKNTPVTHGLGRTCKPWRARSSRPGWLSSFMALGSGLAYKCISPCGCNPGMCSSWQMQSRSQKPEQI